MLGGTCSQFKPPRGYWNLWALVNLEHNTMSFGKVRSVSCPMPFLTIPIPFLKSNRNLSEIRKGVGKIVACTLFPLDLFNKKLVLVFRIPPYWRQFLNDAVYCGFYCSDIAFTPLKTPEVIFHWDIITGKGLIHKK